MKRREFITLLGGTAAAWPLAARAQQSEHIRRIGVLSGAAASIGGAGQKNVTDFVRGLQKLGWIEGENIRIEIRWSAADQHLIEAYASDLVGLFKPDVILSSPEHQEPDADEFLGSRIFPPCRSASSQAKGRCAALPLHQLEGVCPFRDPQSPGPMLGQECRRETSPSVLRQLKPHR